MKYKPKLIDVSPLLIEQWDSDRNGFMPEEITIGCSKSYYWKCGVSNDHRWQARVVDRVKYSDCPFCKGKRVSITNCLAKTHPHVLNEWDYERNSLTPQQVTYGSGVKVHWKCNVSSDHLYESSVHNKLNGTGCPCCHGLKAVTSNCLVTTHPHLVLEWDDEKISPFDVTSGSRKKVCWKCNNDPAHRWRSTVCDRTAKLYGCPRCNDSHGEKLVEGILQNKKISYKPQYSDERCRHIYKLRFDFALFNERLVGLVEFNGEQHYRPVSRFGGNKAYELVTKRDNIKRKFCIENKIPLLEIPYTQINTVEEILSPFLASLDLL